MTKIFDTSTVEGIKQAERFKMQMENEYKSVNVYACGFYRIQIVALGPIGTKTPEQARKDRKNDARRAKHEVYKSLGLTRVVGACGGVYYE